MPSIERFGVKNIRTKRKQDQKWYFDCKSIIQRERIRKNNFEFKHSSKPKRRLLEKVTKFNDVIEIREVTS